MMVKIIQRGLTQTEKSMQAEWLETNDIETLPEMTIDSQYISTTI